MIGNLSDSALEAMAIASTESQRFSQYYLGTEHLFIGLCKVDDAELCRLFQETEFDPVYWRRKIRAAISVTGFSSAGDNTDLTPRCKKVMKIAERLAHRQSSELITPRHLFLAILAEGEGIPVRLMRANGYEIERLGQSIAGDGNKEGVAVAVQPRRYPFLESVGRDLTQLARANKLQPTVGRDREMLQIAQSLRRKNKGNVLVVGDAGTGKSALVYGFAQMTAAPDANDAIKGMHLFEISLSSLLAGTKYRGEFEERVKQLIQEASSDSGVVLFLDEFHLIKGAGGSGDSIDVANLLKPALASGEIKCIGATTIDEFRRYIEPDDALTRRFEILTLAEPTPEETGTILHGLRPTFESYHGVTITDDALETAIYLADRYISDRNFPDKAIDLLDKACANAIIFSIHGRLPNLEKPVIDRTAVAAALRQFSDVTIPGDFSTDLRDVLLQLEGRLSESVIGQEAAVAAVTRKIQVHCAGLGAAERPIGAFLFAGPTGVGKTELARAIAIHFFGTERKLIRFDMSEYSEAHSISRLIGAPPGYVGSDDQGLLSRLVRSNPHSVVLFDEMEKAHADIHKIFLQILEPGRFTDNHGRLVRFNNTVVIFTSNIGSQFYVEAKKIGIPGRQALSHKVVPRVLAEVDRVISPELRNRMDAIIAFEPLEDQAILHKILDKQLREIRALLSDRGMEMTVAPEALDVILAQGYNMEYGARHLKRTLDKMIKEPLALKIHLGVFGRGDVIRVEVDNQQLLFDKT